MSIQVVRSTGLRLRWVSERVGQDQFGEARTLHTGSTLDDHIEYVREGKTAQDFEVGKC